MPSLAAGDAAGTSAGDVLAAPTEDAAADDNAAEDAEEDEDPLSHAAVKVTLTAPTTAHTRAARAVAGIREFNIALIRLVNH
jgi:hypothetical protein